MESVWPALRLSIQVACLATWIVAGLGGALGYWLARDRGPLRSLVDALVALPLVLPPTVTGFYLLVLLGQQGPLGRLLQRVWGWTPIFHWSGAVLAAVIVTLPLMTRTTRAALESVDVSYLQAARTLGQNEWEVLVRVWLPLGWRGILAGVVLSFARALGEFGATLMVAGNIPGLTQTMPMAIYEAVQVGNDAIAFVLVLVLSGISLAAILLLNALEGRSFP